MDIVTIGYLKSYVNKTLTGMGAVKGTPCQVEPIIPTYSPLDPSVVISNTIKLKWDSNLTPGGSPVYHEETFQTIDNGRAIYKIEYDPTGSSAAWIAYIVTFYNGETTTFKVPSSSGSMKKIVVDVLPPIGEADKNAIYLVPVAGKTGVYNQFIAVEDATTHAWEWLALGSTEVDMTAYQKKIDDLIEKMFPNYDPETKILQPTAKNVVGAINEFIKVLNANYDYTNNIITNLTTKTKTSIVDAINDMGNIENLEDYGTYTPTTLVDGVNHANKKYKIDFVTADKEKMYRQMRTYVDQRDGSGYVQQPDSKDIPIPRVDIKERTTAATGDFRTYDLYMANLLYDNDDPSQAPFGKINIPKARMVKEGEAHQQYIEISSDALVPEAWHQISGTNSYWQDFTVKHKPVSGYGNPVVALNPTPTCASVSAVVKDATNKLITVTVNDAPERPTVACTPTTTYEGVIESLAGQYWLQIEDKPYSEVLCGAKIEIEKSMLLKDVSIKTVTEPDVPYPGAQVGEKYIDMVFELADGTEKHAYIPCKDLFDPYHGYQAIRIEYDATTRVNTVKLVINDPTSNEALTQDDSGLRIWDASESKFGVVKYATQEEVRTAASSTQKVVKPYNLYDFAINSPSVDDTLEGLWTDPDTSKHHNQTIVKAINEVASARVKKELTPEEGDVDTYKLLTYPKGNTASPLVTNQLGETIHVYKQVIQVPSLIGVTTPKEYILYYLKVKEGDNFPGLYMYVDSVWKRVLDVSIEQVKVLPTTDIRSDIFYGLLTLKKTLKRYKLTDSAITSGYKTSAAGIKFFELTYTWTQVNTDLATWIASGRLEEAADGIIYQVEDNSTATPTTSLVYDFSDCPEDIYYYIDGKWFTVNDAPISLGFINDLFIVD